MDKVRPSKNQRSRFTRLMSAAGSCRQQIGLVTVMGGLALAIVMNIAMTSETTSEKAQAQIAYLNKTSSEKSASIQ